MIPRTKIIATLGPASTSETIVRKMVMAGLDVVRLNFSHGLHPDHLARLETVRKINRKYRRHIRILQDLEGHRIRVGRLPGHQVELKKRQTIYLIQAEASDRRDYIPFDYQGKLDVFKKWQAIYIDDGNLTLEITGRSRQSLTARVIVGGTLKEHKGINVPEAKLKFRGMTEKDTADLEFGIASHVDFVAQSFVQTPEDVTVVREYIGSRLPGVKIIAKIENREGIKNIDGIIDACDGIMIARGDMGISVPICEIPFLQMAIIRHCISHNKPVITATQMLESMTEHTRPTRAEVTDVANAILDGTDFVMLSEETAAGKYPVESVAMMNEIIKCTERSGLYRKKQ